MIVGLGSKIPIGLEAATSKAARLALSAPWTLLLFLIVGSVINNQPWALEIYPFGSVVNVLAILTAVALAFNRVGCTSWLVILSLVLGVSFLTRGRDIGAFTYLTTQNAFFFFAGSLISNFAIRPIRIFCDWLLLVCVFAMLLQITGVGEWTQFFATHGTLADGTSVPIAQVPTLFRSIGETGGTFLQGRPAGIFHSNQNVVLFVVFILAIELAELVRGSGASRSPWWRRLALFACILTQSKAAILSFEIVWIALFFASKVPRTKMIQVQLEFIICVLLYWAFFPGIFQIYMGPEVLINSALVRLLDLASLLGIEFGDIRRSLSEFAELSRAVNRIGEVTQRTSGFSQMLQAWPVSLVVVSLIGGAVWRVRKQSIEPTVYWTGLLISLALIGVLVSAALLASQLFWFIAGIGMPWIYWSITSPSRKAV